jgi:GNAT superfamily N-acetyltransferase
MTTTGERLVPHGLALPAGHTLLSVADRRSLWDPLCELNSSAWPELMLHDPVASRHWDRLAADFAAFQMGLHDAEGELIAGLNSAPLPWDGTLEGLPSGWDDQLTRTVAAFDAGVPPDTLGALQVVVRPDHRGRGYAARMIEAMRATTAQLGLRALIACVRPTEREPYALIPIDRYARWVRADGLPVDAWIRLHVRLGGRVVRAVEDAMHIEGSVADWRAWTELAMPESGSYLPPGVGAPVLVDLAADRGVYRDPGAWVIHDPS